MFIKRVYFFLFVVIALSFTDSKPQIGQIIDEFSGVNVYYNGKSTNVVGRHYTTCGYNLGLKFQCIEFIKRYYFEVFNHKMPDSYGHAKSMFDKNLQKSWRVKNKARDLFQYHNGNFAKPNVGDILIFDGDKYNSFGHIGIISEVGEYHIELIQQNYAQETREKYYLTKLNDKYYIANEYVLGWLSMD